MIHFSLGSYVSLFFAIGFVSKKPISHINYEFSSFGSGLKCSLVSRIVFELDLINVSFVCSSSTLISRNAFFPLYVMYNPPKELSHTQNEA